MDNTTKETEQSSAVHSSQLGQDSSGLDVPESSNSDKDDALSRMVKAITFDLEELMEITLSNGLSVNAVFGRENDSLLGKAAINDSVKVAEELVVNNADLEARSIFGDTPLAATAFNGSLNVLHILLDHGANINSQNDRDFTPLHYAAASGQVSVVCALLHNGASRTMRDIEDQTPYDVIYMNQDPEDPYSEQVLIELHQLLED